MPFLQLLSRKEKPLLVRWNTLLVLDLPLVVEESEQKATRLEVESGQEEAAPKTNFSLL